MLLVSIDTLRADRLGCYGYARPTTPALDRFAEQHAVRFAHAFAEAPWTLPSHTTMLTGLHPLTHGVRRPEQALDKPGAWLAERLDTTHYAFGVTDGGWLSQEWGFASGFESFHAEDRDIDAAVELVLQYVRHRRDKGPWFGFLHTYDVHCPYDPPPPYAGTFASEGAEPIEVAGRCGNPHFNAMTLSAGQARYLSDRYDEDVRRVDDALARLFAALDALDLWKNTIVIVTSDHGEEFQEHGQIGHERTLSREVLAVPLLIAVPGFEPKVVEQPAGLADLVPTLLELVGSGPGQVPCDGKSLVAGLGYQLIRRAAIVSELDWQRALVAESDEKGTHVVDVDGGGDEELLKKRAALLASGYKPRVVDTTAKTHELSDLGYGGER